MNPPKLEIRPEDIAAAYLQLHGGSLETLVNRRIDGGLTHAIRSAQLLNIKSVAKILDCPEESARDTLKKNKIKPLNLSPRNQRWRFADVAGLIDSKDPNKPTTTKRKCNTKTH